MSAATIDYPAAHAVSAINNALQLLLIVRDDGLDALDRHETIERASALLGEAMEDVGALQQYIDRQEENIATMIEESNETHRTLTAVSEERTALAIELGGARLQLAEAQNTAEELVRDLAALVGQVSALFTRARGIRLYDDMPSLAHFATPHAPRTAAAGV